MDTRVETKYGVMEGFKENGLIKWFGIPFAQPPVGELRFRRAVECEKWTGVKECKTFGNKPVQFPPFEPRRMPKNMKIPESEDCLYLNIWRPDNGKKKLPVFVWIYGGAFHMGEGSDPTYDGSAFAQKDILYVTFNYRVGVLGFYDFTIYDQEHFDSNCGLSDQIMALKWVKENIEAFGGDPDNITIAGESAGGASVCCLLAAPSAKGLFHKAIVQSGLPGCTGSKNSMKYNVDIFLEQMKMTPESVSSLRMMDAQAMIKAATYVQTNNCRLYPGILVPGPTLDDLLPESPVDAIPKGSAAGMKLIIGTNHDEGMLLIRMKMFPDSWEMVEKMCQLNHCEEKLPELYKLYRDKGKEKNQLNLLVRDRAFLVDSIKVADGQSQYADVWMYRFDYAPLLARLMGFNAMHGCEVPIALNTLRSNGFLSSVWRGTSRKTKEKFIREMHTAWVNFAKSGNPNGHLDFEWEPYDSGKRKTLIFDKQSHMQENPDKDSYEVWKEIDLYP
jgi:para-nitrobenzyl esterase